MVPATVSDVCVAPGNLAAAAACQASTRELNDAVFAWAFTDRGGRGRRNGGLASACVGRLGRCREHGPLGSRFRSCQRLDSAPARST